MNMFLQPECLLSSKELQEQFGTSCATMIPLVSGRIPYIKCEKRFHLRFPREIWVEAADERSLTFLLAQQEPVPVFMKDTATGKWRYKGHFVAYLDPRQREKLGAINQRPPRSPVVAIVNLKRADANLNRSAA